MCVCFALREREREKERDWVFGVWACVVVFLANFEFYGARSEGRMRELLSYYLYERDRERERAK